MEASPSLEVLDNQEIDACCGILTFTDRGTFSDKSAAISDEKAEKIAIVVYKMVFMGFLSSSTHIGYSNYQRSLTSNDPKKDLTIRILLLDKSNSSYILRA